MSVLEQRALAIICGLLEERTPELRWHLETSDELRDALLARGITPTFLRFTAHPTAPRRWLLSFVEGYTPGWPRSEISLQREILRRVKAEQRAAELEQDLDRAQTSHRAARDRADKYEVDATRAERERDALLRRVGAVRKALGNAGFGVPGPIAAPPIRDPSFVSTVLSCIDQVRLAVDPSLEPPREGS